MVHIMDTVNKTAIGRRIREFRKNAGLSQEALSEKADIDKNNLSRIERGSVTPALETLLSLCNALDITPNDILLESYHAPTKLLDAEIASLLENTSDKNRQKVIEYIHFLKQLCKSDE